MTPAEVLTDGFGRVLESARAVLDGLTVDQIHYRPTEEANPIGWLIWHLARVQDDHVAGVAGTDQVYVSGGFAERFDLPYPVSAIGYGQKPAEVGAFAADRDLLVEYLDAVHTATLDYLRGLSADDLDAVVDTDWDPPVTLGARLVSVLNDDTQHVGQAAYVRGVLGL